MEFALVLKGWNIISLLQCAQNVRFLDVGKPAEWVALLEVLQTGDDLILSPELEAAMAEDQHLAACKAYIR